MAANKINKSAFVRSLPASMPAADVVKAASAKGIKLSVKFVHTIRYNAKMSAKKKSGGAVAQRGPGRPAKVTASVTSHAAAGGLVGEIERIVERKVAALLKERLGALFA